MYNYQTFLREQTLQRECMAVHREHSRAELQREHSSPALVHAHKKRVEAFILSAIDKPVPVTQYTNHPPCFRSTSLGSKGFYLRRESQSQRVEKEAKKNAELDHVPFSNTFSHQFREHNGKGLRFKPYTHNLRVREYLDRQELNYLPNHSPKPEKTIAKQLAGQQLDLSSFNHSVNKTLLPMLHAKTYFKSVSTLFTEVPIGQRSDGGATAEEGLEEVEERRLSKPNDHLSRKENSREALLKCNMLAQKIRG